MSSNKKRINLSFSMSSPIQRRAWKKLTEIPAGQRTAAVCRMVCEYKGQQELLDAVRQTILRRTGHHFTAIERHGTAAARQRA